MQVKEDTKTIKKVMQLNRFDFLLSACKILSESYIFLLQIAFVQVIVTYSTKLCLSWFWKSTNNMNIIFAFYNPGFSFMLRIYSVIFFGNIQRNYNDLKLIN